MGGDSGLLGREGAHEREVLRRVKRVQSLAAGGVERERMAQAEMFQTRPQKLVAPSQDTPMSMFQAATWAMAFPDLFPWGDGVPFLKRETPMEAAEVFRYLLLRVALSSPLCSPSTCSKPWRCTASADIRELIRSPDVDVSLASVLAASANILGTEGHRSPNLADSRAPMFLQLHLQDVQGQVEGFQVNLNWDLEEPSLPSLPAMRRALAANPVSQARFFHKMMLLEEEILGTLAPMTMATPHRPSRAALATWLPFAGLWKRKAEGRYTRTFFVCWWGTICRSASAAACRALLAARPGTSTVGYIRLCSRVCGHVFLRVHFHEAKACTQTRVRLSWSWSAGVS